MRDSPCHHCPPEKKSIWCHSTCKDYKDYRAEIDRDNEMRRKEKQIEGALIDVARQGRPKRKRSE